MTTTNLVVPATGKEEHAEIFRDIHKGLRALLFSVTGEAGRTDPFDHTARAALAGRVNDLGELLELHAHHEDTHIQPVLAEFRPDLADEIARAHAALATRVTEFRVQADAAVDVTARQERSSLSRLYLELASFTGTYLLHQDFEEQTVEPALEAVIGVDGLLRLDAALVASIPPDKFGLGLTVMLPAMNVAERTSLLAGVRDDAPAEVFAGIWALAQSVLGEPDFAAVARALGA